MRPALLRGRATPAGVPPGAALARARLWLAVLLGLRLAMSPFVAAVGQPEVLWQPRGTGLLFLAGPPPVALVLALQLAGVAGAALHLWRRRLGPLVLAWACLLVLAGVRTSLGKVLHNDVLLVLAGAPLLLAGGDPDEDDARTGLDAAVAVVLLAYLSAAWWKLYASGPAWALSDNLRWALAAGRGGARWGWLSDLLIATPAACVVLACGILALELGAPLVWLRPRMAPVFVVAAATMHAGTWLVLGLDYFAHLAIVALVVLSWAGMRTREPAPPAPPGTGGSTGPSRPGVAGGR